MQKNQDVCLVDFRCFFYLLKNKTFNSWLTSRKRILLTESSENSLKNIFGKTPLLEMNSTMEKADLQNRCDHLPPVSIQLPGSQ